MSRFRKIPHLLIVAITTFLVGIAMVMIWFSKGEIADIGLPTCYLFTSFPGRSVDINEIQEADRSIYSSSDVFWNIEDNKLLEAFGEVQFNTETLTNGKEYPEAQYAECYRFFWLRSFQKPVLIKTYEHLGEHFIVAKSVSGRPFDPGQMNLNTSRRLTNSEWCELVGLVEKSDFWNKEKIDLNHLAYDGSFWIVEGIKFDDANRTKKYYITGEQSPHQGAFFDACVYLVKLSELEIDQNQPDFY